MAELTFESLRVGHVLRVHADEVVVREIEADAELLLVENTATGETEWLMGLEPSWTELPD